MPVILVISVIRAVTTESFIDHNNTKAYHTHLPVARDVKTAAWHGKTDGADCKCAGRVINA
jgi:hypothetical protein